MKNTPKSELNRLLSLVLLVATLLGYVSQSAVLVEAKSAPQPAQQYSYNVVMNFSDNFAFDNVAVEEHSTGQSTVYRQCGQEITRGGTLLVPNLQNTAMENTQNNFAQQTYKLDPTLSQNCFTLSISNVHVQKSLAVRSAAENRTIAVRSIQKIAEYKFEAGDSQDNSAVALQNNTENYLNVKTFVVTNKTDQQKVFAAATTTAAACFRSFHASPNGSANVPVLYRAASNKCWRSAAA